MTYNEAIKLLDGDAKALAEALECTHQMVYQYKKNPDKELPKVRTIVLQAKLGTYKPTRKRKIVMTCKAEVV